MKTIFELSGGCIMSKSNYVMHVKQRSFAEANPPIMNNVLHFLIPLFLSLVLLVMIVVS